MGGGMGGPATGSYQGDLAVQVADLREALAAAIESIEGLEGQQAMPDDSYMPGLQKARATLAATAPTTPTTSPTPQSSS
jgi:hypothetical protein